MSISAQLRAAARAAYRDLYRASSFTFAGDEPTLKAFRLKMREDALSGQAEQDPVVYQQLCEDARNVAAFLRRNIIQATKQDVGETWSLHINEHTELGDNDSIKNPPKMESSRSSRKRDKAAGTIEPAALPDPPSSSPNRPMYYSALKKAHKERKIPELKEEDIQESFVRGSGPGGQSVNKTENNVQLLHKPTGIRVSCQETRSLAKNRELARRLLLEKLDRLHNPGLSKEELKRAKQQERERRRRKKAKKKALEKQKEEDPDEE
ncbi:hypothetical protein Moror_6495 [Moniliophthora roreri MCA 2997]|uniref:Prokaryotic-type class I peptide chain release factors domain-containing protein n=2 Tax=Moniliophthora roreri TaxID=221103 RepID=V2XT26_MONRO|nr:hypothetical protein Moror_6495 [Moniliophthora roreri MCA 2997]KAI3610721.1 hypothetical protein WG66_007063 [Moniliophthora roreri]